MLGDYLCTGIFYMHRGDPYTVTPWFKFSHYLHCISTHKPCEGLQLSVCIVYSGRVTCLASHLDIVTYSRHKTVPCGISLHQRKHFKHNI